MSSEQQERGEDAPIGSFDQTNGRVSGLDGDSDGTAAGDMGSAGRGDSDAPMPLKRVGAANEFGLRITPTDAAGHPRD